MDTKLKADIAESAVTTELLKRGFRVLRPVGDRLAYDLAIDFRQGKLLRIQVKSAWFDASRECYTVDVRRTKTNRRRMLRKRYNSSDFDFAIVYLADIRVFYIMPISVFSSYESTVALIEADKRQRKPRSAGYRERWDLLSDGAAQPETAEAIPAKFGGAFTGNTEPSPEVLGEGVETRRQVSTIDGERYSPDYECRKLGSSENCSSKHNL